MKFAYPLALCAAAFASLASAQPTVREDRVQILDVVNGKQAVAKDGNALGIEYQYRDRGRGPTLSVQLVLDADGIPVRYESSGNNERGGQVKERFVLADGVAEWSDGEDAGRRKLERRAFYWPAHGPPEMTAVLARALLKAPGGKLELLPSGTATLTSLPPFEWTDVNGERRKAVLHQIGGLDFSPLVVWLDPQGETVAVLAGWVNVVVDPFATEQAVLQERQDAVDREWNAGLARRLTHVPAGPLVLRNARLFDPKDGSVRHGMSVRIQGERIVAVKADAAMTVPAGAEVIDAGGRFVMPGLWDVHKHYDVVDGPLDLAGGITSSRDMANRNDVMLARVQRFDEGSELGPRVHLAGIMEGVGERAGPTPIRVDTVEKAQAAVDWYGRNGYTMVKVYSLVPPTLLEPIAERAHGWGMKVIGHGSLAVPSRQFVEAGASEVSHLNILARELVVSDDTPIDRLVPQGADLRRVVEEKSPRLESMIAWLRAHETVLDPTVAVVEKRSDRRATGPSDVNPVLVRFPVQARRSAIAAARDVPLDTDFGGYLVLLKALHDAGIPMMPGSDGMAGFTLHRELELWSAAGIPNASVLRSATMQPALYMGVGGDRGRILPGMMADLIVVDGDPLVRMSDIRRVWRTIKGGKVYEPEAIERELGMAPR